MFHSDQQVDEQQVAITRKVNILHPPRVSTLKGYRGTYTKLGLFTRSSQLIKPSPKMPRGKPAKKIILPDAACCYDSESSQLCSDSDCSDCYAPKKRVTKSKTTAKKSSNKSKSKKKTRRSRSTY
ncbi:unnamed protein product [Trichogramma brassicae]|uniref:Uncharacterized protein n=1 Tax=Trichogramma brassicae TaxID=86971 RepID=A0A6H5IBX2_9HYME|nr:unnamed protein product [Trichogramma brassicae]